MTSNSQSANDAAGQTPEPLQTLAGYLERSLDKATSIVMIRHTRDACTVYLGDPAGPSEELKQVGTMTTSLANSLLEATASGVNQIQIGDQSYRFVRSFTQVGEMAAVVFAAD
ncbi:hypothetical protein AAGS40_14195 [Paraburkholderia sp. PREW-6R]|uniref:hypothetical protein n=1 Tax=Paraburkholderia sp. PREW-6R TaxID=3141544 RepID=UPI0031F5B459